MPDKDVKNLDGGDNLDDITEIDPEDIENASRDENIEGSNEDTIDIKPEELPFILGASRVVKELDFLRNTWIKIMGEVKNRETRNILSRALPIIAENARDLNNADGKEAGALIRPFLPDPKDPTRKYINKTLKDLWIMIRIHFLRLEKERKRREELMNGSRVSETEIDAIIKKL